MPNPYFRFKQFTVWHDRCAMKVGTDGVLLGIWANVNYTQTILDVGTGTGLISLMLAQRSNALITAIDIDRDAIMQATANIEVSPFGKRAECRLTSLQDFAESIDSKYDLIASNPPFFEKSLKSPDKQRTTARHADSLGMADLIRISASLLTDNGRLALIYPHDKKEALIETGKNNGLYATRITNVYPTPTTQPRRFLMELSRLGQPLIEDDLVIEIGRHIYSDKFTELAKDFYLKL